MRERLILLAMLTGLAVAGCTPDSDDGADDEADATVDGSFEPDVLVLSPQCDDGEDNDGDGLTDGDDPGCADPGDDDESDDPLPQCRNEVDDDGDGDIDLADRGCANAADDDESDEPPLPACQNGVDDDDDGFVDFPADPGCGSEMDDDEVNEVGPALPQCGDGLDNDGDGRVDLADPGCSSPADPRETDAEVPPGCSNRLDDDDDGIVDFPLDPGCSAAGDEDEADRPTPPFCANGLDDDGDGRVDYPADPGCAGFGDGDEADPMVAPQCADGVDNDRDDTIDFPEDPGCEAAADASERGSCGRGYDAIEVRPGRVIRGTTRGNPFAQEGTCGGRGAPEAVFLVRVDGLADALRVTTDLPGNDLETALYVRRGCTDGGSELACAREPLEDGVAANELILEDPAPGTYYVFLDGANGRGGDFEVLIELVPPAACRNGADDDEDGRVDYPVDPGCDDRDDRDEADPDVMPQCADDLDNDGDGLVDYPLDAGCRAAADGDEVDLCGQGVAVYDYPVGEPFIIDDTSVGGTRLFGGSCGGNTATEKVFVYQNPFNTRLVFSTDHEETTGQTVLYVRTQCAAAGTELGCSPAPNQQGRVDKGTVTIERAPPGDLFVIVDHPFGLGGPFKLSVEVERLPPGCRDEVDNDQDGFIDGDDPGCADLDDEDERDPEVAAVCFNGEDDDGDGWADYPLDPGCASKGGADETDPDVLPACANGEDDDEDGLVDYPLDEGCSAAGDPDEESARRPICNNRIDDDDDGLNDYPLDPGCAAPGDLSEQNDDPLPECANGIDDDRDGLVDFPIEPGCSAAGDDDEDEPDPAAACSNGADDDGDGITDFPREPGCEFAGDDDETDPNFAPQCANERDDDNNGRFDWPDDPGCRFAADPVEQSEGALPPRCADGRDNDDDGLIDLIDIGCENARDNDEEDLPELPLCANALDDDEDGLTDWPDDDGCAAAGDVCEQDGWGFCDGACVPLRDNPLHCGRCGRACSEGVECTDGRCGELREIVRTCGNARRDVNEFIQGQLVDADIRVEAGVCEPGDDVQAILVPRGGVNAFEALGDAMRDYVNNGGVVLTEYNISHRIYNTLLQANVAQGARNGDCSDNVQPAVQFNPQDQFWQDNIFRPIAGRTGCGYSVSGFPDIVPLGGWDPNSVSLAYIDVGAGRLWLVEADWQDSEDDFNDVSRALMAYMIANGAVISP